MKTITDNELDLLLQQSAQHHKAVEQINSQVMKAVRKDMRRKTLCKWGKLLTICFGLPLMVIAYLLLLKQGIPFLPEENMCIAFIVPVLTLLGLSGKFLHDFSVTDL